MKTDNHYQGIGPLFDICRNRHRGNEQSVQTFETAMKHRISAQQKEVLELLRRYPEGLTCDEAARIMMVTPNQISGRFTELKRDGKIYKFGTRLTRGGNPAAVLRAIEE
jgi:hypothetical protein